MALIFDIQVKVLDFNDGLRDFVVRWTKKYADIDDEDDVVTVENAIVDKRLGEANFAELFNEISIPNSSSLFLSVEVCEKLEHMIF